MVKGKQIAAGAVLFGVGVCVGFGLSGLARRDAPVAPRVAHSDASIADGVSAVPKVARKQVRHSENVSNADVPVQWDASHLDVTPEELEDLKRIAISRGEKTLPPQEWVDHVYRRIKKARAAKKAKETKSKEESQS